MGRQEPVTAAVVAAENEEATEAWSGVLFDRFLEYRDLVVAGLGAHGNAAMRLYPPGEGDRVLDIGCGFGDTTQQLAALVGAEGHATGVDVAEPFIEASIEEAGKTGIENVDFFATDVQVGDLKGPYDYAFSRMGVMFFANPVQAFRNVAGALRPGGRLVASSGGESSTTSGFTAPSRRSSSTSRSPRSRRTCAVVPARSRWPTPTPSPSSSRSRDSSVRPSPAATSRSRSATTSTTRSTFNMAIGPAAELLRICPADEVDRLRPKLQQEIRGVLADYVEPDGVVRAPASTWIVSATVPE